MFGSDEPALATIGRTLGPAHARAATVMLMAEALEFFNLPDGMGMTDTQVAATADLIIEEYPYLKTDDLKLCFRNAMKGRYGKVYNRIDGQIVLEWLRRYDADRLAAADAQSWQEHVSRDRTEAAPAAGSITRSQYLAGLEAEARQGDGKARAALEEARALAARLAKERAKGQWRRARR